MSTPRKSYEKAKHIIEQDLGQILEDWKAMKEQYETQLNEKPDSWAGIGKGSELEYLRAQINILSELLFHIAN